MASSTRTLLKQVPESEWGGPDRHPHSLPTLEHMWHQGHRWDREHPAGCAKWGCTAVTTSPHSTRQSGELAQVPREKHTPVSLLIELTKPQLLGLLDTTSKHKTKRRVANIWLRTILLWLMIRLHHSEQTGILKVFCACVSRATAAQSSAVLPSRVQIPIIHSY